MPILGVYFNTRKSLIPRVGKTIEKKRSVIKKLWLLNQFDVKELTVDTLNQKIKYLPFFTHH